MATELQVQAEMLSSLCARSDDSAMLLLRAALPEDAARLERMFYRLSPDTIYFSLFVPVPRQPYWAKRLAALARADGHDHDALVALASADTHPEKLYR